MGYLRLSFTERRRAALRKKFLLDRLETKNTITEPISVTGLSISALRGLAQLGIMSVGGGNNVNPQAVREASQRQAVQPSSSGPRNGASTTALFPIGLGSRQAAAGGAGGNASRCPGRTAGETGPG